MNVIRYPSIFIGLLLSLIYSTSVYAQYQMLQILPPRIVVTNERSADLTLINRADSTNNYRLFMRNIRTDESGMFHTIDQPVEGELFSDSMVRFSPRRVTVDARSQQSVRVVIRKPRNLPDGEYRSHLVFRSLPTQEKVEPNKEQENVSMLIRPNLEITIPVIVRQGSLSATVSFSDVQLMLNEEGQQQIRLKFNRDGARSVYGDVYVWWKPSTGEEIRIAFAKGNAVYFPNKVRNLELDVESPTKVKGGKLRIQFIENQTYGGDIDIETIVAI